MIKSKETVVETLNQGTFPLGVTMNESGEKVYFPNGENQLDAPKVFVGAPTGVRQTYLENYLLGIHELGHNAVVFESDFFDREWFEALKETIGETHCQQWDFSSPEVTSAFSFDYEELYADWDESNFQNRWHLADLVAENLYQFLFLLSESSLHLSIAERLLFNTVVKVVFVHPHQTLYEVYNVVTDYETRQHYINKGLSETNEKGETLLDEFDLKVLSKLNELRRERDVYTGEFEEVETGKTYERAAEPIVKLFKPFFANYRIREMFKNPLSSTFHFSEVLSQKQVIFVQVMQPFYSESARMLMINFLISKLHLCRLIKQTDEDRLKHSKKGTGLFNRYLGNDYPLHLLFEDFQPKSLTMKYLAEHLKEISNSGISIDLIMEEIPSPKSYFMNFLSCDPSYFFIGRVKEQSIENLGKRFSFVSSPTKDNEFVCCIPSQGEYKEIRALLMNEPATV